MLWSIPLVSQSVNYFEQGYDFQGKVAENLAVDIFQDQVGFIWVTTSTGLVRYDGREEKYFVHEPDDSLSLRDNALTALAGDANGWLWVGSMNSGVYHFDPRRERFIQYGYETDNNNSLPSNRVNQIFISQDSTVWVATEEGLARFDPEAKVFRRTRRKFRSKEYAYALAEDEEGNLLVGGATGIDRWNPSENKFDRLVDLPDSIRLVKTMRPNGKGGWWVGCQQGGLHVLEYSHGKWTFQTRPNNLPPRLSSGDIWQVERLQADEWLVVEDRSLYHLRFHEQDSTYEFSPYRLSNELRFLSIASSRDGLLWCGTNDGVSVLAPRYKRFRHFDLRSPKVRYANVGAIAPGPKDEIWLGNSKGLNIYATSTQKIKGELSSTDAKWAKVDSCFTNTIYADGTGGHYLGVTWGFGAGFAVYFYRRKEDQLIDLSQQYPILQDYPTRHITGDEAGNIWLGGDYGLLQYLPKLDSLRVIRSRAKGDFRAEVLLAWPKDTLWVGTMGSGLWRYLLQEDQLENVRTLWRGADKRISENIYALAPDDAGRLWVGTSGGLLGYSFAEDALQRFTRKDGLVELEVRNIIPIEDGVLWLTEEKILSRLNLQDGLFTHYELSDGIGVHQFNNSGTLEDEHGNLYFTGSNGVTIFHPDDIQQNPFNPPVVFTKFNLFNQEITPGGEDSILTKSLPYTQEITLRKEQNVFSIEFAALSYLQPGKNNFAVRLAGFETDWQYIGNEQSRTYTNLDPGHYQLEVKAANNDGKWSENKSVLNLQVLPPWYNTWWAWCLYAFLFGLGIYAFLRAQRQALETRRIREMEAEKARFYVGITHQFRTPLTLIQGPVKLAMTDPTYQLDQGRLSKILNNCGQLLGLIDRLLQLSKIEAGFLSPRLVYGNVIPVLADLVDAFREVAATRNLQLNFTPQNEAISMDYDHSLLVDITNNLLANAAKYTPEGGTIEVTAAFQGREGGRRLIVKVLDNGPAIPEEEKDKIFDRFYRINAAADTANPSGTGIGLALSRKLAELLGGTLSLQTGSVRGNTFCLQLPIQSNAPKTTTEWPEKTLPHLPSRSAPLAKSPPPLSTEDLPLVLVIEDQAAVAAHIMECLQSAYRLHWAEDGQEGLDWASAHGPDLVISDVMMPKMDGFAVCQQLKTTFTTSHLPVMLLTARADQDSRLSGLTRGADAYLAKPFDPRELRVRCEQLLRQRQRLANYYQQLLAAEVAPSLSNEQELTEEEQEEYAFVLKVKAVVQRHYMDDDFNVQQLADKLPLDRTTLSRKLKSLAQITPTELIRSARLQQAQKLLADPSHSVAEVAFACGFSDPDYFSRLFRKELGVSPSDFRATL